MIFRPITDYKYPTLLSHKEVKCRPGH